MRFFVVIALMTLGAAARTLAASPDWSLRDYVHTVWTHRDGIPLAPLTGIAQTTDGYLWLISQRSLVRFDGIRFMPVPVPCDRVYHLAAGPRGSLWVLCRDPRIQLFRRDANGVVTETTLTGLPVSGGPSLFSDRRDRLWILYPKSVARLDPDGQVREIVGDLAGDFPRITEDADATIWLFAGQRVIRIRDDGVEDGVESPPIDRTFGLAPARAGGVLLCHNDRIRRVETAMDTVIARAPRDVSFLDASGCMAVDAAGTIWIGTRQHGIALVQDGRVETSLARNEIGAYISEVFVDREDTVWVASAAGLHRLRRPHARLLSSSASEVPPIPVSVFVDSRQDIWIKGSDEYVRLNLTTGARQTFPGSHARAFAEDAAGRIWVSTNNDIGYIEGGTFRPVRDVTGAAVSNVSAFTKDGNGDLWAVAEDIGVYQVTPGPPRRILDEPAAAVDLLVSSRHGVWLTLSGGGVKQYVNGRGSVVHDTEQGLDTGYVQTLLEDGDSIWMGDSGGLLRWRGGRWTRWTRAHGLPSSGGVQEITRDRSGRLWLMTSGGIVVLSREDLGATPDGAPRSLTFMQIGSLDRVVPHPGPPTNTPRVSIDRDGRLYFATIDSVAIVDPAAVSPSALQPSIVLESVVADNQPVDAAVTRRLIAPSRLQFAYTSLSLRSPENIRFRYKLEGYDADWIEAGSARQVTYGTLRPGPYRFHVIGSGSEGVWNTDGAVFAFDVVPLFYNTWWFRVLIIGSLAAAVAGVHRLRVRRLTQEISLRFEERLAERTRIAGDLHDTLLQTLQGSKLVSDRALKHPDDLSGMRSAMEQLSAWLGRATTEGRLAIRALREGSTVSSDLADALRVVIDESCKQGTITGSLSISGKPRELHPSMRDEVHRIAHEAIRNACAHSGGSQLAVAITYGRDLRVRVTDNGNGVDSVTMESGKDGHFGLRGMRERAQRIGGTLSITSSPDAGTTVTLSVPGRAIYRSR